LGNVLKNISLILFGLLISNFKKKQSRMDFGNINSPPDQQAMINALMQQIEALKRNGNDDILALITAKLTQEAAAASTPSFSSILPSPSSSISSPSTSSLMSQLPTPLGIGYSNNQQQQINPQSNQMTNIASSSFYHPSSNNPLSPPSIIPSPGSAFCIPSGSGSVGTPSSMISTAAATPLSGPLGQLPQQSEIAKLLESFSFTNILQNVQNLGNPLLNFQLSQNNNSSNSSGTNLLNNNNPAIPLLPVQHQHHQQPPTLSQPQTPYLQPQQHQQQLFAQQQNQQPQQISYSQPSTSSQASFLSNASDDESIIDERHQQDTPKCTSITDATEIIPTKRKRKLKQQYDSNGKPIVQRIRRRRRNGEIPEEDSAAAKDLEKVSTPGCRKQPSLPDNEQQQQIMTSDDAIIHSPPSLRPNQMISQIQGFNNSNIGCQQNDISQHNSRGPTPAASTGPSQNYASNDSPGSFQRSDSLSGDESRSRRSKTCRVCGDIATGYNFNVITCESCKAFFRRNANRTRGEFKCPYSDDCEINAVSRRFCQKCRLKKCFTVGMKKEWILNEDQLKRRKNSRLNHNVKSSNRSSSPYSVKQQHNTFSPKLSPSQSHVGHHHRNVSIDSQPMTNRSNNDMISNSNVGNVNRSFSVRSSMDMTSPASINATTPVSLSMMSPVNSMSPSSSSIVSTSTPPQMSPKIPVEVLSTMKFLTLDEIIHGYVRNICQTTFPIQTQPNTQQTVKIVVQTSRLFNNQMTQYFGCGECLRISLPITDYAKLITLCGNNQSMELQNGDISLPEEAYEPLKKLIENYTNRAVYNYQQQQQQQQQISPTISYPPPTSVAIPPQSQPQSISDVATPSPDYHCGPLAIPTSDGYTPNCNEIRTTSILPSSTVQYDPIQSLNTGPQPEVNPELLPQEYREHFMIINTAIKEEFENNDYKPSEIKMRKIEKPQMILNSAELKELDAIRSAFTCMDEPLTDLKAAAYLEKPAHNPSDILNVMDITIRRIVKTAKKLSRFQEISNDGKMVLLKSSMIDMLTIRGVVLLDEKKKNFSTTIMGKETKISLDMFDNLRDPMQRERFMTFYTAIHPTIRKNQMCIMLVALVVLFDDSRAIKLSDSDRAIVRHYHEMYYHLLQRYAESVYGEQAPEILKTVPVALQRLAKTSETSINLFLGRVDSKNVEKLPTEFFITEVGGTSAAASSTSQTGKIEPSDSCSDYKSDVKMDHR
jgi:nuclear receptor subfamily 1 group I